jgi:hypothetical protein
MFGYIIIGITKLKRKKKEREINNCSDLHKPEMSEYCDLPD